MTKQADVGQETTLVDLIDRFGADEDKCREFLEHLRWPDGVHCPRCGFAKVSRIAARNKYDCNSCRYQFSVTAGTVFGDTHLPLWKWFLATYLMIESKKGISANQLKRTLRVSYKTAWYLCHRIRSAMGEEDAAPLNGTVEVDETYVGGKRYGVGQRHARDNKTMVLGAIQRGGGARFKVEEHRKKINRRIAQEFIESVIAEDAEAVYTDQEKSYRGVDFGEAIHDAVDHSDLEWVRGDVTTNGIESAWSLFKRSIVGSYHQLSAKHLDAYLDEFAFRFNNRENPFLFRDTLLALLNGDTLTFEALTSAG